MSIDRPYPNVTVYLSSSESLHPAYRTMARDFGSRLARTGRTLVYGGGGVGLMGEVARAFRAQGGHVVGIITERLRDAEQMDPDNHETIVVTTMRERKRLLELRGDAFVILPGGLGTLEEFFEILVGRLLGEHDKPIIILNADDPEPELPGNPPGRFYAALLDMIDQLIASRFASPGVRSLFSVCDTPEEVVALLDEPSRLAAPSAEVRIRMTPSGVMRT